MPSNCVYLSRIAMDNYAIVVLLSLITMNGRQCLVSAQSDNLVASILIDSGDIQEGNSVTIQCHLSYLQDDDGVVVRRQTDDGQEKSVMRDGEIVRYSAETEDGDLRAEVVDGNDPGSKIHKLTFGAINRTNAGSYSCHVTRGNVSTFVHLIASSKSIDVLVQYLPPTRFPMCSHDGHDLSVTAGEQIVLRCVSEDAIPKISLLWFQRDSNLGLLQRWQTSDTGLLQTIMNITATKAHNGVYFTCELYGQAFAGMGQRNCSIGPILVLPRDDDVDKQDDPSTPAGGIPITIVIPCVIVSILVGALLNCIVIYCCCKRMACIGGQSGTSGNTNAAHAADNPDPTYVNQSGQYESTLTRSKPRSDSYRGKKVGETTQSSNTCDTNLYEQPNISAQESSYMELN